MISRRHNKPIQLDLEIQAQPDDSACGPTCLPCTATSATSVRSKMWSRASRARRRDQLSRHPCGHARQRRARGATARRCSPSTSRCSTRPGSTVRRPGDPKLLDAKLREQARVKAGFDPRFGPATEAYLGFLELGGQVHFRDLSSGLLASFIRAGYPVLTGLARPTCTDAPVSSGPTTITTTSAAPLRATLLC